MRLVQFIEGDRKRWVGVVSEDGNTLNLVRGTDSVYALARAAIASGRALQSLAAERVGDTQVDYQAVIADRRVLVPIDHPEPARCMISGTGLTHPASAMVRNRMHQEGGEPSDTRKLFDWGLRGGKPAVGELGVQPEWFYKGNGAMVVAPEHPLPRPSYAEDGGGAAELVGLYVIADDGTPCRVGYALGNEFADHAMERRNYHYLGHSKLRACSFGPELLLGEIPADIPGSSRIWRNNALIWEKSFRTGEDNMCHSLANLEYHHFKYPTHRRPWDMHVHFFGAAALSAGDDVQAEPGDIFEIQADGFGRALRNPLVASGVPVPSVRVL